MKKNLLFLGAAMIITAFSANVNAAGNTTGKANLVDALTLTNKADLDFGTMCVSSASAICKMDLNALRTTTSGTISFITSPAPTCARYEVTGNVSTSYNITIPTVALSLTGSPDLTVGSWQVRDVTNSTDYSALYQGKTDASGKGIFELTGSLTIPSGFKNGQFTTTFDVTIAYQ